MTIHPMFLESGTIGRGRNNRTRPNTVLRPAGTSTWLIEYTVAGCGRARAAGVDVQLKPGSFLMYEAGTPQDYDMDMDTGEWDHIWFCFDPRPHWQEWLRWPEVAKGTHLVESPDNKSRVHAAREMERALALSGSVYFRRRDMVMNILEGILLYCDIWNPSGNSARLDDRVRSVLEYINEHIAEKIDVVGLAAACSLSPSRMSHLFSEQMGKAPMQHVESRRLELARELLLMTSRPVKQIAVECGYESPFYFSRVFKARCGLSPRQARDRYARLEKRK